jgi:hypothetical protein
VNSGIINIKISNQFVQQNRAQREKGSSSSQVSRFVENKRIKEKLRDKKLKKSGQ